MTVLFYTFSILLMVLLPVALAVWLRRRSSTPWILFSLGALTFLISQAVHIPLNNWLADIGWLRGEVAPDLPLIRLALTLGLTAGLCEELARTGAYALIKKFKPAWLRIQDAFMLGIGHGGIEAMIIGVVLGATLSALMPLRDVDLSTLGLETQQLETLQMQLQSLAGSPFNAALPLLERLIAITAHVTLSLIVWQAFLPGAGRRSWLYIPLAVLYHAGIDFIAVLAAETFRENLGLTMLSLAAALIPGWIWVAWKMRKLRFPGPVNPLGELGLLDELKGSELSIFWTSTKKELRQLWRTKRILVMGAVFLIFGMGSPLIAKLTPQILGSIEGAEVFADLIPEPTAGDAMLQYIDNLSQFGFILVVLLAMGMVVGEKERKTIPMVLSKPMPRWAFITSKFFAQTLMYLLMFTLSSLGAYYYTLILFESLNFGAFLLLNGLLLLWMLTFVALSMLGSTLGKTTVAAGGIGLGLSVALMLAGSLPLYGSLLPGGLISWVRMLGQSAAGVASSMPGTVLANSELVTNAGAAVSALVVIVMALVISIGVFEQQEL
jgi:ABC-2 type transport system permease protein